MTFMNCAELNFKEVGQYKLASFWSRPKENIFFPAKVTDILVGLQSGLNNGVVTIFYKLILFVPYSLPLTHWQLSL